MRCKPFSRSRSFVIWDKSKHSGYCSRSRSFPRGSDRNTTALLAACVFSVQVDRVVKTSNYRTWLGIPETKKRARKSTIRQGSRECRSHAAAHLPVGRVQVSFRLGTAMVIGRLLFMTHCSLQREPIQFKVEVNASTFWSSGRRNDRWCNCAPAQWRR